MISINIRKAEKLNGDYSMFVTFPYNTEIVNVIREMPTRFWDSVNKLWELPFTKFSEFISKLPNETFDIIGEYVDMTPKKVEMPTNFHFKTEPFAHQIEGFEYGLANKKWFLGDEQGLGKTKQVIDIAVAKKLQFGYKHCLIICGVNGLKWNWAEEIALHSDEGAWVLGQRKKGNKIVVASNTAKEEDLDKLFDESTDDFPYFLITNIETLRVESIVAKIVELCKNNTIPMIAFDECHKAKNPSSQQGKGFLKINTECMIAMTGTPLMNSPVDLYIILKWLGYENHSFYSFKNHYCIMGGFGGHDVVGYKHLDELQDRLNEIMLRRLKADVLDLPEKMFVNEYVEMTARQSVIYKEVTAEIKAHIDEIAVSPNPLAQLIRLRQATGYTGILSSEICESAKLDRMEEIVEEAVSNGKKVVIFSNWTQMTTPVRDRLSKYNPAVITGEISADVRQAMKDKFQNNDSCKVIVGTIGAMGTGLTLTAGTVEIFLDEPWTMAMKNQAVDRCHRIGAKDNITIYTLMAKNTIDERIHSIVEQKGAMSDAIVDGKVVGNKKEILQFLLD